MTLIDKENFPKKTKPYSLKEEIAHSITHGLGVLLGVIGLTVLLVLSTLYGTNTHLVCYLIYGISMILLYTFSTLYHSLPQKKAKHIFKILDHASIYLLIAGSYTPFLVLNLKGTWGLSMMLVIWSLALAGVIFKIFFTGRFKLTSTLIYLAMGWLVLIATKPMLANVPMKSLWWVLIGGICYTVGTLFYLMKKLSFHHAIWHLFVLAGSICHYIAIIYSSGLI